jgi:hypothetical protein
MKPICSCCFRLHRQCVWNDGEEITRYYTYTSSSSTATHTNAYKLGRPSGQSFVVEFPNLDQETIPYIHHFVTFCCRFLAYSNDGDGNPFQKSLVPLAVGSPALLHSMAAVSAGHLARTQEQHQLTAQRHYAIALRELKATLSDPGVARSDSTLGACLMLCVYEVLYIRLYFSLGQSLTLCRYRIPRTRFGLSICKEREILSFIVEAHRLQIT